MVWFFIGGILIAVFLLAFLIVDVVYAYRIYTNSNITNGEAIFLIVVNLLAVLIVLSMMAMFFFQVFRFIKKTGSFAPPPITPDGIMKELGFGDLGDGEAKDTMVEMKRMGKSGWKKMKEMMYGEKRDKGDKGDNEDRKEMATGRGCNPCNTYAPPVFY